MTQNNPLTAYFRQPKHYTPLPSKGRWYANGALDYPATGELAIYPMTAKDEITLKTPDALLNGQSSVEVIQSCIPNIKNAWEIPSIDVDTLFISIRIASYGNDMEISPSCPKCNEVNHYDADLKQALAFSLSKSWEDVVPVGGLKIHVRPLTYKQLTDKRLQTFQIQRLSIELERSDLPVETKREKFSENFAQLRSIQIEFVTDSIESIETPDGITVSDRGMIKEFIQNADRNVYSAVQDIVESNKDELNLAPLHVRCEHCQHEWDQPLEFDSSNFFG